MSLHEVISPEPPDWGYPRDVVDRVWEMAERVTGNDAALWRKDLFGAWIHRLQYGNNRSEFGWEIADIDPTGHGNRLSSLRPFQWQNHRDLLLAHRESRIMADGLRNIRRIL